MPTLTIFANFYVNSFENFTRLRDSFLSFKNICAERWVINTRGKHKARVTSFLSQNLGEKLIAHQTESKKGWFFDSQQLLEEINSDYVLFWVEDHINQVDTKKYDHILLEMQQTKTQYLRYSWWWNGKLKDIYSDIDKEELAHISSFTMNEQNNLEAQKKYPIFLIDLTGIFSAEFFKKLITTKDPKLRRWPKNTPFDFEKKPTDTHWLPFKFAIPNYELFASIDDDHICPGYSLQSRGLYPKRILRKELIQKSQSRWRKVTKKILFSIFPKKIILFFVRLTYHII